jgi:hypothetical protein
MLRAQDTELGAYLYQELRSVRIRRFSMSSVVLDPRAKELLQKSGWYEK